MRVIVDLALDLSKILAPEDILSILAARLKQLVPYDCLVIYVRERSAPEGPLHQRGEQSRSSRRSRFRWARALSGWVVENGKAIINGNPAVEPGYAEASGRTGCLELRAVHSAGRRSGSD